ncbi:GIY-YIG nuclease family protein [Dyella solisilvae]|nr:GIY-YIG nuclease family protein [Dyella solisilvae]
MLTIEQSSFLLHHKVPWDKVMDATGIRKKDYQAFMSSEGLWVAYGVSPCREGGHTLRTRSGHCAQCNPAALAFLRRHDEPGWVYIATSEESGLCKVGTAKDVQARISMLNRIGYGYATDWVACWEVEVDHAGRVESAVHQSLAEYRAVGGYLAPGYGAECTELFDCDADMALDSLNDVLASLG